jgi:hypothetical protein
MRNPIRQKTTIHQAAERETETEDIPSENAIPMAIQV